jgi:carbonic anhydrase
MKAKLTISMLLLLALGMFSCQTADSAKNDKETKMLQDVVTAEAQKKMTPADVLADLKAGNKRFIDVKALHRDHLAMAAKSASGQFPKAAVVSCVDSRVPVEIVLDQGIGDLFVGRVAGNFVDTGLLGSLEFATKVSGSKVILVLGHESCGAVKAAIDDVKLGNITGMLEPIRPVVLAADDFNGDKTSKNAEFVARVCNDNVKHTIEQIRERSPIIKEMEDNGEVMLVGGVYELGTGKIEFLSH